MSLRKQRRLLAIALIGWAVWGVAFISSMVTEPSRQLLMVHNSALAVAVAFTVCWALASSLTPVTCALRALLSADQQRACESDRQAQQHVLSDN